MTTGADLGFFLRGGALVSCSTSTPINHIFFLQNTSCIRKPQVISGGEGGCRPLHPPPRSVPEVWCLTTIINHHMVLQQWKLCWATPSDIYQLPQNYTSRMLEQYNQARRKVKNRKKILLLLLLNTKVYTYTREDPLPLPRHERDPNKDTLMCVSFSELMQLLLN